MFALGYTKISDVDDMKRRIKNESADMNDAVHWTCGWQRGASVYILAFVLEADISSIWKADKTVSSFNPLLPKGEVGFRSPRVFRE